MQVHSVTGLVVLPVPCVVAPAAPPVSALASGANVTDVPPQATTMMVTRLETMSLLMFCMTVSFSGRLLLCSE